MTPNLKVEPGQTESGVKTLTIHRTGTAPAHLATIFEDGTIRPSFSDLTKRECEYIASFADPVMFHILHNLK